MMVLHINMMRFQMHFSLDENERKLVSYLSEKLVLRMSEMSTIEQPLKNSRSVKTDAS